MDITVRRLNHRLALQLPKELPLGLVFVVGVVGEVKQAVVDEGAGDNGRIERIEFELIEEGYNLRCVLVSSGENPTTVWAGEKVRVGGHLTFDPRGADYFLMTHNVEIIFEEEAVEPLFSDDSLALVHEQEALADALAGVKRRAQSVAALPSAELPVWVQKIAPPEVQDLLGVDELDDEADDALPETEGVPYVEADSVTKLPSEMVTELSAAMDDEADDVVVTTELLFNYVGEDAEALGSTAVVPSPSHDDGEEETAVSNPTVSPERPVRRPVAENVHETDWLVILLIIVFVILIVVLIVATATLLLR